MADEQSESVKLTQEQEANLQRHLRHQKRERTREPDLEAGMKQGVRYFDLIMNRILPAMGGLGMISWGLDFGSGDPGGGVIAVPAMFIGAVLILGAAAGSRLISILFWVLGGFSSLTWLFFG